MGVFYCVKSVLCLYDVLQSQKCYFGLNQRSCFVMKINDSLFTPDKIIYVIIGLFVFLIIGYVFAPQVKFSCDRSRNTCILSSSTPVIPIEINKKYYKLDAIDSADSFVRRRSFLEKSTLRRASKVMIFVNGKEENIFSSWWRQRSEFSEAAKKINTYLKSSDNFLEVNNPGNQDNMWLFIVIVVAAGVEFFRRIEKY